MISRRGQVSLYVIIAIVIVAGVISYFVLGGKLGAEDIPLELEPVFDYYHGCVENEARAAIELASTQGGRVYVPDYMPGSEYAPFSSQLNFFGFPVPYWFYVSGNGLVKENVPKKSEIENEMARFVEEGLGDCDLEKFYRNGYVIEKGEPNVKVNIENEFVDVKVDATLSVSKGEDAARKVTHEVRLGSQFGKFYLIARKIYKRQKEDALFEQHASDILRLYAPVDGVLIQCAPKIWSTQSVMKDLRVGLEENFRTLKFKGDYYELSEKEREYFVLDEEVDASVNVMYLENWPTKIEIEGEEVDDSVMIAEDVGTQEGMGLMGFCYVPYHFVYDLSFPTLIQIYNNEEIFQFPVVVIIDNNRPREALLPETLLEEEEDFDLCEFKTQEVEISLYNVNLNNVEGNISYECFNQRCRLGETENGVFRGVAPACVNGFLHVRAEGYADKKEQFSSNKESYKDILMEREYLIDVDLLVGGDELDGTAIVSFVKEDGRTSAVALPEAEKIKLSEGSYDISVYVYGDSSITIPASTKRQCNDMPQEGLLGFLGFTQEKCFDISTPETKVDYALIGGGTTSTYLLESELEEGKVTLRVDRLPSPNSMEQLQKNFELLEVKGVAYDFHD